MDCKRTNCIRLRPRITDQKGHCGTAREPCIRYQNQLWVHLPSRSCVIMAVSSNLSGLQFPHLKLGRGRDVNTEVSSSNRGCFRICYPSSCTTGLPGKGRGVTTPSTPWSAGPSDHTVSVCLHCCYTSGGPILRTLPSSSQGNVAMPTRWLLLITIYECAEPPSDKQFSSSLAWRPSPNCHKTDHLVPSGIQQVLIHNGCAGNWINDVN